VCPVCCTVSVTQCRLHQTPLDDWAIDMMQGWNTWVEMHFPWHHRRMCTDRPWLGLHLNRSHWSFPWLSEWGLKHEHEHEHEHEEEEEEEETPPGLPPSAFWIAPPLAKTVSGEARASPMLGWTGSIYKRSSLLQPSSFWFLTVAFRCSLPLLLHLASLLPGFLPSHCCIVLFSTLNLLWENTQRTGPSIKQAMKKSCTSKAINQIVSCFWDVEKEVCCMNNNSTLSRNYSYINY